MTCRDTAIKKIVQMPKESVSKVLIFMAGMEAEQEIDRQIEEPHPLQNSSNCKPYKKPSLH